MSNNNNDNVQTTVPAATTIVSPTPATPVTERVGLLSVTTPLTRTAPSLLIETPNLPSLGRAHLTTSVVKETSTNKNNVCNTSHIIDENNIPEVNILLPLRSIMALIKSQFICKKCHIVSANTEYELETFGVANAFHCRCACGHQSSAYANLNKNGKEKTKHMKNGDAYKNKVNSTDFDINAKLLLGIQLGGGGRQELKNLSGMMNIACNPMAMQVTELREYLSKYIMEIAKQVLAENLQLEKSKSPTESNGKKLLTVSNDARWDKRGSGRRYDSVSGCSVMFGCRAKLPIGLEAMSTQCVKCDNNTPHDFENCLHTYDGSSKGMEATGAITLVNRITAEENNCNVAEYVSDDDASSRAILTHCIAELVEFGFLHKDERPKRKSGGWKTDNGQLSVDHPPIEFRADKNHRVRIYSRPCFGMANGPADKKFGVTNIDAERMKRRMSWTLRLFTKGTFDEFKTAVLAVLEHHFDHHEHCGDWCKAKGKLGKEKEEHGFKFRSKTKNDEMYSHFKKIHLSFMGDEALWQLFHDWDTNPVEGFNKLITKFLPKDRNFATTIENKARIHLSACLLSIGYQEFFKRLFERCGLTAGDYCLRFLIAEDRERRWRKNYRTLDSTKTTRMRLFYTKIKEGREKLARDNKKGLAYGSGMMVLGVGNGSDDDNVPKKKGKTNSGQCQHCGKVGHSRKSSSHCGANPKNIVGEARKVVEVEGTVENGTCDMSMCK